MSNYRLVYSTDPKDNKRCARCKELTANCTCKEESPIPEKITVRMRIEKAKRGGKTVTVLRNLPAVDSFLKELAKELKNSCGTGGTYAIEEGDGVVEIQGDRREQLRKILEGKGMLVKG